MWPRIDGLRGPTRTRWPGAGACARLRGLEMFTRTASIVITSAVDDEDGRNLPPWWARLTHHANPADAFGGEGLCVRAGWGRRLVRGFPSRALSRAVGARGHRQGELAMAPLPASPAEITMSTRRSHDGRFANNMYCSIRHEAHVGRGDVRWPRPRACPKMSSSSRCAAPDDVIGATPDGARVRLEGPTPITRSAIPRAPLFDDVGGAGRWLVTQKYSSRASIQSVTLEEFGVTIDFARPLNEAQTSPTSRQWG